MRHKHSEYMHWAKQQSHPRFHLATSGVGAYPLRELQFDFSRLEINGDNSYGFKPLLGAISAKYGVGPDHIVEVAGGTSMANHLAMAAILEPGDEVLVEQPAYGPLLDAARYLQAEIKRFPRPAENGFAIEADAVRAAITPKTRLIVLTNLHNPTSVLTPEATLQEIGDMAASVGAYVLVDEVYLDAVYENTPRSSVHLGTQFVATNSLTKVYGLSGLRCGWILAAPDLVRRMRLLNDVYGATNGYPAEVLSAAAFQQLDAIRDRARRIVDADRVLLAQFLERTPALSATRTEWGTTSFIHMGEGVDDFLIKLREEHETSAVPGRFFETPTHFRLGMGVNSEMFAEGLQRIAAALP